MEAAKAAQREAKKEACANSTQVAKQNAKAMGMDTTGMGLKAKGAPVEERKKGAAVAETQNAVRRGICQ